MVQQLRVVPFHGYDVSVRLAPVDRTLIYYDYLQ